ncbi:MAG: hypothetical protein IKQ43_05645 [Treponema sp.]|nr:hypothetical protein [Treponema sp.]
MIINRKILIIAGAVLFISVAAVITGVCLGNRAKSIKVGFYELDSDTEDIFVELIKNSFVDDKKAPSISFEHLDKADDSVDMILMPMGKLQDNLISSIDAGKKNPSLPLSVMSEATSSMRQKAVLMGNNAISIPLLMDNVEMNILNDALAVTNTQQLQTWSDIEKFASDSKANFPYPIVFAGADAETTLSIITALTECYSGDEAYLEAVKSIIEFYDGKDYIPDSSEIAEFLETIASTPESPLYAALSTLARWINSGLIHPGIFTMTKRDVEIYMENRYSSIAIMTLSDHRRMSIQALKNFTSLPRALGNGGNSVGFFPSSRPAGKRYLTGSVISAVPLTKNKALTTLIKTMLSSGFQADLAFRTGLAPVNAQCQTPDIQADDVRFFIAATNAPLTPLNQAAFADQKEMEAFALEITTFIKKMRK